MGLERFKYFELMVTFLKGKGVPGCNEFTNSPGERRQRHKGRGKEQGKNALKSDCLSLDSQTLKRL